MERRDQGNVRTPEPVVALHDRGDDHLRSAARAIDRPTKDRKPKVQMFVVFTEDDLTRVRIVDSEDADALAGSRAAQCLQAIRRLDAERRDKQIPGPQEHPHRWGRLREEKAGKLFRVPGSALGKTDRVSVGEIHRAVEATDLRFSGQFNRRDREIHDLHGFGGQTCALMLEGRTTKSFVRSSMFITARSCGGGAMSLRASRFNHPPELVTRALSFPSWR